MLPIVKEILESLKTAPGQWSITDHGCYIEADHPSGIHVELYELGSGHASPSSIKLTEPRGGTICVGYWDKRRLWKAIRRAVHDGLKARTEARLGAFKFCPFCGKEIEEKT